MVDFLGHIHMGQDNSKFKEDLCHSGHPRSGGTTASDGGPSRPQSRKHTERPGRPAESCLLNFEFITSSHDIRSPSS